MKRMGDRVIFIIKNKIRFLVYVILFLLIVGGAFLIVEAKNQSEKILQNS